jgi:hypothetical protein
MIPALIRALQAPPLPAEPPIGGVFWAVVVPALLLASATAATVMLYRHFAREEKAPPSGCA